MSISTDVDLAAVLDAMTPSERSLLLYLETCAVDRGGIVRPAHLSADDFTTAARWNVQGFLRFSRIPSHVMQPSALARSNRVVELLPTAWACAALERRRRAERSQDRAVVQPSLAHFEQIHQGDVLGTMQ